MTKEHKYAEILRAIAEGKQIQGANGEINEPEHFTWNDVTHEDVLEAISLGEKYEPLFYRVKPETPAKEYPVTSYTGEQLCKIYYGCEESLEESFIAIANAAIARYIDEQEEAKEQDSDKISDANDGWIVWNPPYGVEQGAGPVPDKLIKVMLRSGLYETAIGNEFWWGNTNHRSDIVAYKIIK